MSQSSSLLRFQIGPVQDFIAAARSTRDLWSGSYLLSWLVANAVHAAERAGASAVMPSVGQQPVIHHLRHLDGDPSAPAVDADALKIPNLPNIFLVQAPADKINAVKVAIENSFKTEWAAIFKAVWKYAIRHNSEAEKRWPRFFQTYDIGTHTGTPHPVSRYFFLAWQITYCDDEAFDLAGTLPDDTSPREARKKFDGLQLARKTDAGKWVPESWAVFSALNQWQLDAIRQTRTFSGIPGGWANATDASKDNHEKDALTGREEMITGHREGTFKKDLNFFHKDDDRQQRYFKHEEPIGALTLVKRLWHLAWLAREKNQNGLFNADTFSMPNVPAIAAQRPWLDNSEDDDDSKESDKYYAVLALDGDDMGKWASGEKSGDGSEAGLRTFSAALSNFALHAAPRIVAAHKGRLIYAGGDDVLAMLSVENVFACADDLQRAFRGLAPGITCGIAAVTGTKPHGALHFGAWEYNDADRKTPLLFKTDPDEPVKPVPGALASASVGIAIAHVKAPLQDVVRAAQAAEHDSKHSLPEAKDEKGKVIRDEKNNPIKLKNAFAVTVMKRSGEISKWVARFGPDAAEKQTDTPPETKQIETKDKNDSLNPEDAHRYAIEALRAIRDATQEGVLSAKFPHRLIELIAPYRSPKGVNDLTDFETAQTVEKDILTVADRQRGPKYDKAKVNGISDKLTLYLKNITGKTGGRLETERIESLIGLLTTVAFIARQKRDDE
jgi:CRISPR-associated protein Cmr2